jgi:hypothetical protein
MKYKTMISKIKSNEKVLIQRLVALGIGLVVATVVGLGY